MKAPTPPAPAGSWLRNAKPKLLIGCVAFSVAMPLCLAICAVHSLPLGLGLLVALGGSAGVTLVSGLARKNRELVRTAGAPADASLGPAGPHTKPAATDSPAAAHMRAEAVRLAST